MRTSLETLALRRFGRCEDLVLMTPGGGGGWENKWAWDISGSTQHCRMDVVLGSKLRLQSSGEGVEGVEEAE